MTREEAEPIIVELLRNLSANPNFAAPRQTFEAIDVYTHPNPDANGHRIVTEMARDLG